MPPICSVLVPPRLGMGSLAIPVTIAKRTFSTTFAATENPISEGGIWSSNATDRTRVATAGGIAIGTQVSTSQPPYDDSYAYLNNGTWGPDIEIIVTIFKGVPVGIQELECNFRCQDSVGSTAAFLYEINLAHDGQYCNFGGWGGDATNVSNFFGLAPDLVQPGVQFSVPGGVHDGDLFKCTLVGNALNAYINYNDGNGYHIINTNGPVLDTSVGGGARYTSGKPGIGFYNEAQHGAVNAQFGMRDVAIREV